MTSPKKPAAPRPPAAAAQTLALVEAAAADAAVDLSRTDATNATNGTLAGVVLTILVGAAGLTTGDASYPAPALAAMGGAAACLSAVLVVLAAAMWPRRGGGGGVPRYAALDPEQLVEELGRDTPARWHAERAVAKARIACRRHAAQRLASVMLAAASVLLALATILTLTG